MYHGVSRDDEELEATTVVRRGEFRQQMGFLKQWFGCLTTEEVLNRDSEHQERPGAVVTFDDGYANNLEIALPILEEFEIPAIIYVTTGNACERRLFWPDKIWMAVKRSKIPSINLKGIADSLGTYTFRQDGALWQDDVHKLNEDIKRINPSRRENIVDEVVARFKDAPGAKPFEVEVENNVFTPLNPDQIAELSAHPLITIGAHSHCHNLLNQIPLSQAEESIRTSKEILERLTGRTIEHFSYPNGNLTDDIIGVVKRMGFKSAVTVPTGFFKYGDDPYRIPRYMVGPNMSMDLFKARMTGIFSLAKRLGF
jgi:peptidoglycan/xylan/chitin deacetylase (PgdA/CDA1 family)